MSTQENEPVDLLSQIVGLPPPPPPRQSALRTIDVGRQQHPALVLICADSLCRARICVFGLREHCLLVSRDRDGILKFDVQNRSGVPQAVTVAVWHSDRRATAVAQLNVTTGAMLRLVARVMHWQLQCIGDVNRMLQRLGRVTRVAEKTKSFSATGVSAVDCVAASHCTAGVFVHANALAYYGALELYATNGAHIDVVGDNDVADTIVNLRALDITAHLGASVLSARQHRERRLVRQTDDPQTRTSVLAASIVAVHVVGTFRATVTSHAHIGSPALVAQPGCIVDDRSRPTKHSKGPGRGDGEPYPLGHVVCGMATERQPVRARRLTLLRHPQTDMHAYMAHQNAIGAPQRSGGGGGGAAGAASADGTRRAAQAGVRRPAAEQARRDDDDADTTAAAAAANDDHDHHDDDDEDGDDDAGRDQMRRNVRPRLHAPPPLDVPEPRLAVVRRSSTFVTRRRQARRTAATVWSTGIQTRTQHAPCALSHLRM